jgi:hypothetical protein
MAADVDHSNQMDPLTQVREHIQQLELAIVAQNEIIATLELGGRDAREARAVRAQLWVSQEVDRAEMDRLLAENKQKR